MNGPSAELCINQNSIVLVSQLNKFPKQESSCMQKEHIIQSQTANQASATQMKIPAELQAEELFGTTMWPSTPTFATTQADKVLFCIFKRPSYCVNLIQQSFSKCERRITDFCSS